VVVAVVVAEVRALGADSTPGDVHGTSSEEAKNRRGHRGGGT